MFEPIAPTSPAPAATAPPPQASAAPAPAHHLSFHEILHDLNPLQYIPLVGSLYRAITGDTIPEAARDIGSVIVGGLMGGPIGAGISVATIAAEKATGIDPDKITSSVVASAGLNPHDQAASPTVQPASVQPASVQAASAQPASHQPEPPAAPQPMSPTQLAAYGITTGGDGTLHRGTLFGSDVLNQMELARIEQPGTSAV